MEQVNLLRLLTLLIAVALSFGPLAMSRAMAAQPAHHSEMTSNHCDSEEEPSGAGQEQTPCCGAACAGAAIVAGPSIVRVALPLAPATAALISFERGTLSEIATPPPRTA